MRLMASSQNYLYVLSDMYIRSSISISTIPSKSLIEFSPKMLNVSINIKIATLIPNANDIIEILLDCTTNGLISLYFSEIPVKKKPKT